MAERSVEPEGQELPAEALPGSDRSAPTAGERGAGGVAVPGEAMPAAGGGKPAVQPSRAGRAWVTIALGLVLLAVLLVFVFQNLHDTTIHFFTASGSIPVALALVLAAIGGAVLVLLVGSIRIIQLRRHVRTAYTEGLRHGRHRPDDEGA